MAQNPPGPFLHPYLDQVRCRLLGTNIKSWTIFTTCRGCFYSGIAIDFTKAKFLHPDFTSYGLQQWEQVLSAFRQ